jgi:hypothetical protein
VIASEEQASSASSSGSDGAVTTICASVSGFFGLIGIMMILISILRKRKINRDLETAENEYQKLQLQVITLLEERYSPRAINSQSNN